MLVKHLTEPAVMKRFAAVGVTAVERYLLPNVGALNFVPHDTPGRGVTRSLALDTRKISQRPDAGTGT